MGLILKLTLGASRDYPLQATNPDGTPAAGLFLSGDTLATTVWAGDGTTALLTPGTSWISATDGQFLISFNNADTASLPPGRYRIQTTATRGGRSGALLPSDSYLLVLGAPGSSVCADLVTQDYLAASLAELDLTTGQIELLPALATAASDLLRRQCGGRDFNQQAYDRIFPIGLDGSVSLAQIPVLKVSRVYAQRNTGLLVTNTDQTTNQRATVEFTCTGDEYAGITYTGLTLTRTASGVDTATPLLFASYVTLNALAAAIIAVGHGWTATVPTGYGLWGSTELIAQDDAAQDCFAGASLDVWANELQGCKVEKRTGILDVASGQVLGIDGPRWGPGWEIFERDDREVDSRVRVIYTAGFVTIPAPVQQATALVVSAMLSTLQTDPRLGSESDGARSYVVNTAFADFALPKAALGLIAPYVLPRA